MSVSLSRKSSIKLKKSKNLVNHLYCNTHYEEIKILLFNPQYLMIGEINKIIQVIVLMYLPLMLSHPQDFDKKDLIMTLY